MDTLHYIKEGVQRFMRDPLGEVVVALFLLLAVATGIFAGIGSLLYLRRLRDETPTAGMSGLLLLLQQSQCTKSLKATFWLGIIVWVFLFFPSFSCLFAYIPLGWLLALPFCLALALIERYELSFTIALKAVWFFLFSAPLHALTCFALILLAFSGVLIGGIGVLFSLPVALYALLQHLDSCSTPLAVAIQKAYSSP